MGLVREVLKPRPALAAGFAASGLLLAGAHAFEAAGFEPCAMCYWQRDAHWILMGVAATGFALISFIAAPWLQVAALGAGLTGALGSAGLGFFHAGVEFGFWPGPASCTSRGMDLDFGDIAAALERGATGPLCDEVPWSLMGISMAGYNGLISLALAAFLGVALYRRWTKGPQ